MAGVSEWLGGARDERGLLIPGHPAKHGADLILRAAQVEVHAGEEAGAALAWEELDSAHRPLDDARDRWRFDAWATSASGVGGSSGLGLRVEGRCIAATLEVCAARMTRRNRFNRSMATGTTVPLSPLSKVSPTLARDGLLIDVLCAVLAQRPMARDRLDDPERVERLARNLQGEPREMVAPPTGLRRSTVEVLAALNDLGHVHPFGGRPVPGDTQPSADDMVAEVVEHIRAHPRQGVTVEEDEVREVVARHHLDIDPWPFGAVTQA